MGLAKLALIFGAALAMAVPPNEAEAGGRGRGGHSGGARHHAHHHHGGAVFFGGYFYTGPYYYYPPYYYPYYEVPLYDQGPENPYWYYCRAANAYYPYVQSCPGGWERYLPGPESPVG
ncbi:MAG TPA: hypothetical protein VEL04_03700 [Burkholderiales bacterium]|nr:hypothetical protein [Burkholderiales bacterium]